MTRSKVELATILVKIKGEITDEKAIEAEAKKLASELSLMKLCYEIQKVEESSVVPENETELTKKEEAIVEELKVPEKTARKKHILSWLLDSSSSDDDDEV